MLGLAVLFAFLLSDVVPAGFEVMFISFAAGRLAEMSWCLVLEFQSCGCGAASYDPHFIHNIDRQISLLHR